MRRFSCGVLAALLFPWAPAAQARPTQDATTAPASVDVAAFEAVAGLLVDDRPLEAVRRVRAELDRWAQDGGAPDRAARLAGLLGFTLEAIDGEDFGDLVEEALLDGLELPAEAYDLRARLAVVSGDLTPLSPLVNWEFVGPFENERGRAITRRTPAEKDPAAGPYEGKVVDVDWRALPDPGPSALHVVDRFVYPRTQYAILARTWVRAERAREACLFLGASEECRLWVNGDALFEARGLHGLAPDAHAIRVSLDEGWNEIVLEVGAQEGVLAFAARLVDPGTAAPIALETSATVPDGVAVHALENPGRSVDTGAEMTPPGARALLADADDFAAQLARAALEAEHRADPLKERPGYQAARAALDARPDSLAAACLTLSLVRVPGALDVEEDVNPYLALLRGALEQHGDRVRFLIEYADHAERDQDLLERAHTFRASAVAARPESVLARYDALTSLDRRGLDPIAALRLEELSGDPALASRPDYALALAGWYPTAAPERQRLLELAADAGIDEARERLRDATLAADDDEQRARIETYLAEKLVDDPSDPWVRRWAARLHLALGDVPDALALLDEALLLSPDDPDLNGWRARVLVADGDLAGAVEALERTLELDLSNADEQRLLEHLSARIAAEGGDAATPGTQFQDRFREPLADVVARHPAADVADADAPREVLLERLVVDVGPDGTARRYRRSVQRILGPRGIKDLDAWPFRAWRGQQEIRVLSARVLSPDGTVREARTGRTGARGFFVVDLPPLEIGDVVDLEWRHDDLRPTIFGDYFGLDAPLVEDASLPAHESEIVVLERPGVDLSYHLTASAEGAARTERELEDGTTERTFRMGDYVPRRREAYEPPPEEGAPRVQASTYANWDEFGTWWWNLIREEVTASDEMRTKVAELTEGKETPLEKLRAIYDFVVTDIRYNAWEFGIHGYQPYSAPVIFSRRFGDCKDKAILMKAMLAEAGIEAWPVIIDAQGRRIEEDLDLALVAHFNHCIAYVPEQDGIPEMFLDGTARLHPLEVLPDSDRGADVLVVKEGGVEIKEIPFPEADTNVITDVTTIDLTEAAGPRVRMVRRPRGRWDPRERMRFEGDEAERADRLDTLLTSIFGALRSTPTAVHPDYQDLTRTFEIVIEAEPEDIGRGTGTGRELPATFAAQDLLKSVARETERETDVLLDVPWSSVQEIEYVLPKDATIDRLPSSVSIMGADLQYARQVSTPERDDAGNLRVRITERIAFPNHRIPAERYDAFRTLARQVDDAQAETLDTTLEVR